ncbi:MAG: site-specific DNA-methyltransferase, partial [Anaerolineae bacterium]|nr:site-specific DNA-methyltransferase [Anaerolineae bacterium]
MTELIWDGKYKDGKRVAPLRVALPFQTVETVNESAQERQLALDLYSTGRDPAWRNRLIWGDKKYVLPSLLEEFAGQVNLIYIDPPFNVGADFSFTATIPENPEDDEDGATTFTKEPSVIEMKAYRDTWGRGLDSYLQWFYEAIVLLRELLAENGSIYVHLDWHIGHYAKVVMDEVFSRESYVNEIVWWYYNKFQGNINHFAADHDVVFWYRKGDKFVFQPQQEERDTPTRQIKRKWDKEKGRIVNVKGEDGKVVYQDSTSRTIDDVWRISMLQPADMTENLRYPTQKPEALLERIINASSNENDLVLDCFAGSGTTAAVAEKLNRRWLACDLGRFAIHTTRKRLLSIENVRPFIVQNLGKYERQVWQAAEFGEQADARNLSYRRFLLDLYKARPITGYTWLHGLKGGRMVHVGAVDSPVSVGDVTNIVAEFKRAIGTGKDAPATNGVDVLGWDFAFELNEVAKQQAAQANINVRFLRIP